MINLAIVIRRHGKPLPVTRQTGDWDEATGDFVTTIQTLEPLAIVRPMSTHELSLQPEADRISGMVNVYTLEPLHTTALTPDKRLSDQILWKGEKYRVSSTNDDSDYGFYKSTCVRMRGA